MSDVNAQGILLRRINYGDNDLIVTIFTPNEGKIALIAKSAKKSKKRFPGILEPFCKLSLVYSKKQRQTLPFLKEASLKDAFIHIRSDIHDTGYANYFVELIYLWLKDGAVQEDLYHLLVQVLYALDQREIPAQLLSIYFQMKFLALAGFKPNLDSCCLCRTHADDLTQKRILVNVKEGGLVCLKCNPTFNVAHHFTLSKGTLKQLIWIAQRDLIAAARIRFSKSDLKEALDFLESFVPYHLGKAPKSLAFIKSLRGH